MAGSIYQKIAKAMSNINRIPKRGYNSFHKYEYVLEADLLDHIRPILLEAGLVLIPTILEEEKNGEFTKVKMEFTVADVETGETIKSTFWGEGQDKNDKGLYKAYTGATKYFLMKTFLIPTGDDPETEDQPKPENQPKPQQQSPGAKPKKQTTQQQSSGKRNNTTSIQQRRFFAICNKKKISENAQKVLIFGFTGKKSRKDLTDEEFKAVADFIEKATPEEIKKEIDAALGGVS
jgi:integrase